MHKDAELTKITYDGSISEPDIHFKINTGGHHLYRPSSSESLCKSFFLKSGIEIGVQKT